MSPRHLLLSLCGGAVLLALFVGGCERPRAPAERDLPTLMLFMERYLEKLYLAGRAGHWELAAFYAQRLEGVGEALRDGGFEKRGIALSELAEGQFLPAVRQVDQAIDIGPEAFLLRLDHLVSTCNVCHQATGYGFVQVVRPVQARPFPAQQFHR